MPPKPADPLDGIIIQMLLLPVAAAQMMVGIDVTVDQFNPAVVTETVMTYVEKNAKDGEDIVAVAITARTLTESKELAKSTLPKNRGIKGKDRRTALEKFKITLLQTLRQVEKYPAYLFRQSRIGDFWVLVESLCGHNVHNLKILVVSDMLEVDDQCNWETGRIDAQHLKIPNMAGTTVTILGVQSPHYRNSESWRAVRDVWTGLLTQAGMSITAYSSIW